MNCSSCGTPLPQGIIYCPSCKKPTVYATGAIGRSSAPSTSNAAQLPPYAPSLAPSTYKTEQSFPRPRLLAAYSNTASPSDAPVTHAYEQSPAQIDPPTIKRGRYAAVASHTKKSKAPLVFSIVGVLVILAVVGGILLLLLQNTVQGNTSAGTILVSKTKTSSTGISGQNIVATATAIITNPQTTSSIDDNYAPQQIMNTFTAGQTVYVTFQIDSHKKPGFVEAKWYTDNHFITSNILPHIPQNNVAYASHVYSTASRGAVELYWCTKKDCSDAQLAQVITFTVTAQSARNGSVSAK